MGRHGGAATADHALDLIRVEFEIVVFEIPSVCLDLGGRLVVHLHVHSLGSTGKEQDRTASSHDRSNPPFPALRPASGTTQHQTASNSDDSPADGIERDHGDQQEREHHEGCPALPVAVSP
jgi:hypothetical protein